MYIENGIAYAGEKRPVIKVSGVRPLPHHRLWVRFSTGEAKIFDFAPYLSSPAFEALKDEQTFREVYIDYGVAVWCDGDIDISPERLYNEGVSAEASA